ncbi:hypothetical protein [Methylobacterium sp. Leaf85]|uniref:hypothetical protein n=1 Tax=Methylobacterium sp. Leaf85 TaxID=1736241 RepID=UPI0006FF74B8|nr:hypothetical protein [Methylobacterium sp. Leaf85]KQO53497.1 hypothetical protein ASF08_18020 [Methylobacterium sp. Leaf85]
MIGVVKEQQAWLTVTEICRKHGINDATVYRRRFRWRDGGVGRSAVAKIMFGPFLSVEHCCQKADILNAGYGSLIAVE